MSFSSNERENMSKLQGSMSHGLTPETDLEDDSREGGE